MPVNLRSIRKRIVSIKSTQQITKAMKMVAAAKLKRAQDKAVGSRPYLNALLEIVNILSGYVEGANFRLLENPPLEKKVAILVYTSSRGLCGSFNSNLIKRSEELARVIKDEGKEVIFFNIGKKGHDYFKKRGYSIAKFYSEVKDSITQKQASTITADIITRFLAGEFEKLIVVHSKFHSAAMSRPVYFTLLPVEQLESGRERIIIFDPGAVSLMESRLPELVNARLFNAILESAASEQGARMTAMEAATTNAGEILRNITLEYNKARQAAITKELIEIVSGAEAQHSA